MTHRVPRTSRALPCIKASQTAAKTYTKGQHALKNTAVDGAPNWGESGNNLPLSVGL
jgi:hypothetical protein